MTAGDLFVTLNDGPVSVIFPVQVTSIIRAAPFASQGLLKEPSPVEPAGQSCTGTLAVALAAGAVAEGAGALAGASGRVDALLALGAPDVPCSSEQPAMDTTATAVINTLEIRLVFAMAGSLVDQPPSPPPVPPELELVVTATP